jgi:transcriptional regulator with XRE-family HTH domain
VLILINDSIAERIKIIRQQKNISQSELAKAADINVKSLSRYEVGTSIPPANALKAISDALGVTADVLLSDDNTQIKDKELFKKFEVIQDMNGETKKMIINFLDLAIRDYKTKQTYTN